MTKKVLTFYFVVVFILILVILLERRNEPIPGNLPVTAEPTSSPTTASVLSSETVIPTSRFFVGIVTATTTLTKTQFTDLQLFPITQALPVLGDLATLLDEGVTGVVRLALTRPVDSTAVEPSPLSQLPADTQWLLFVPDNQTPQVGLVWQEIALDPLAGETEGLSSVARPISSTIRFPNDETDATASLESLHQAVITWSSTPAGAGKSLWVDFVLIETSSSDSLTQWDLYGFIDPDTGAGIDKRRWFCCQILGCSTAPYRSSSTCSGFCRGVSCQ